MKKAAALAVVLVAFLGLVVSLVVMGEYAWPPLFWDANLQVTPAINRANGNGDVFAAYGTRILSQDLNDYRFNWHGQVYQALLGTLLPRGDFHLLMRCMGWLNAATVVICAFYYFCYLQYELQQAPLVAALWGLLGSAALAAVLLHWQGRAEQIIPAILCLSGLVRLQFPADSQWLPGILGATAGVVAATSPLPGVLLISAYVLGEVLDPAQKKWLGRCLMLGVIAAVVWAVLIWLICPYSPLSILVNAAKEAGGGRPRGLRLVPAYWLFSSDYPLIGGIYFVFVASYLPRVFASYRLGALRCAAVLVLSLNLFRWAWTGGLAYPPFHYSLICFFPAIFLRVIDQAHRAADRMDLSHGRLALTGTAVLGLAVALGYARHLGMFQAYCAHGASLAEARGRAAEYIAQLEPDSRIGYDSGREPAFVVLSDPAWNLLAVDFAEDEVNRLEAKLGIRLKYFLYSQDRESTPPPQVGPFVLKKNEFIPGRPRFLGLDLAPAIPGYQFAVYERPTPARQSE